ncbi:PREDICTED: uncharacterized protein LOC109332524 [Lupinus angustifolius]|uniref:uncharacterized protein LOC109332524 n=1 Tax=Lupinus angustifolius TaxID=3871 RepID=UPI00092F1401|nr:PREDICTED: uncharacterized protein LOC109332524 [Lupinus angustifolius]
MAKLTSNPKLNQLESFGNKLLDNIFPSSEAPSVHPQVLHYEFYGGDRGWRGNQNQNQNFRWRQDAGPSKRQQPYRPSYQQGPHPSLHERSGKVIGKGIGENLAVEEEVLRNTKTGRSKKIIRETRKGEVVQDKEGVITNEDDIRENSDKKKGGLPQLKDLHYPKRPSKKYKEGQYIRFLDLFKNLQINIPFMEAMEQMLVYAKFMKDLLTKKRKFSEETVTLEARCSAIIQKSLPEKTKDPSSFTIPITIGELSVGKALLDLGAIINLMFLSMLKRIEDLNIKPTRMTLQLVDRSVKYPYGVAEDFLMKVDGLVFPMDFVIMGIEEDNEVPLNWGDFS